MKRVGSWKRVAIGVFVVAALVFLARELVGTWDDAQGRAVPPVGSLALAAAFVLVSIVVAVAAWVVLLGATAARRAHSTGYLVAQIGKYVPGGVWQVMGQVGFARAAGAPVSQATTAFGTLAVTQVVAGLTLSAGLSVAWTTAPLWLRVLTAAGAGAVVLLDRRWMVAAVRRVPRVSSVLAANVPGQRSIVLAWCYLSAALIALGAAYAVVLDGTHGVDGFALVVLAQIAAWTVGFLAVPIPAGLGVRELALVAILGSTYPSGMVVAASIYLRLLTIGLEGLLALAALAWRRFDPVIKISGERVDPQARPDGNEQA